MRPDLINDRRTRKLISCLHSTQNLLPSYIRRHFCRNTYVSVGDEEGARSSLLPFPDQTEHRFKGQIQAGHVLAIGPQASLSLPLRQLRYGKYWREDLSNTTTNRLRLLLCHAKRSFWSH